MSGIEELERLQEILHENPDFYIFARVADHYLENDDAYRAVQICEDGLKKHPHYVNGHFVYAKTLLAIEELDRAEGELKKVLLYDPKHLGARYYLAQIARSRGWTQNYLTELETILSIDPLFERAGSLLQEIQEELKIPKSKEAAPLTITETEEEIRSEKPESQTLPRDDQELTELVAEHLGETEEIEETPVPPEEEPAPGEEISVSEEAEQAEPAPSEEPPKGEKEEFDYILDEIFEDEVLTEKTGTSEELTEEDLSSAIHKRVKSLDESEKESQSFFTEEEKEVLNQKEPEMGVVSPEEEPPASESPEEAREEKVPSAEAPEPEEAAIPEEETTEAAPAQPESEVYEITEERRGTAAIVTPTLGEIYAAQGHYSKAIGVYEILLKKDPGNQTYKDKIAYLRDKLAEEQAKSGD